MNELFFIIDTASPRMQYVYDDLNAKFKSCITYSEYLQICSLSSANSMKSVFIFAPNTLIDKKLLLRLPSDSIIFCGKRPNIDDTFLPTQQIFSFFDDSSFTKINSKITAEGALSLVISNTTQSLFESKILILGYGNLAKELTLTFAPLCKSMSLATYSKTELNECSSKFTTYFCGAYKQHIHGYDVIINTIPVILFDENDDSKIELKINSYFLDLASISCFTNTFNHKNCKYEQILGLPDKTAPKTAGEYITKFVQAKLEIK